MGGPSLTPATDSFLQRSIGAALASVLGGGGMRNRYRAQGKARLTSDSELILCNLSFRRERFLACGGLDERLYPNEENELLERMSQAGAGLIHDPQLAVYRSQRPTWRLLCRQFLNYGRGRAEQTLISRRIQPASLIPALFLVYAALVPFLIEFIGVVAPGRLRAPGARLFRPGIGKGAQPWDVLPVAAHLRHHPPGVRGGPLVGGAGRPHREAAQTWRRGCPAAGKGIGRPARRRELKRN